MTVYVGMTKLMVALLFVQLIVSVVQMYVDEVTKKLVVVIEEEDKEPLTWGFKRTDNGMVCALAEHSACNAAHCDEAKPTILALWTVYTLCTP